MSDTSTPLDSRRLYLRLLGYVRPYWFAFVAAIACMGLSSIVEPVFPAVMKSLLDRGFSGATDRLDWLLYPLGILAFFIVRALLGFIGDYAMSWVSNNVISELRESMFERIIRLPANYFSDHTSGRLMSRVTYDASGVAGAANLPEHVADRMRDRALSRLADAGLNVDVEVETASWPSIG